MTNQLMLAAVSHSLVRLVCCISEDGRRNADCIVNTFSNEIVADIGGSSFARKTNR